MGKDAEQRYCEVVATHPEAQQMRLVRRVVYLGVEIGPDAYLLRVAPRM